MVRFGAVRSVLGSQNSVKNQSKNPAQIRKEIVKKYFKEKEEQSND